MHNSNNDHDTSDRLGRPIKRNNWLPLLLLPIFFILGWAANDARGVDNQFNGNTACDIDTPSTSQIR